MRKTLQGYGVQFNTTSILCDNTSTINLSKNSIIHSRTKHIDVRHHFLKDHVECGDILLEFIDTHYQLADIFTKPLHAEQFCNICKNWGIFTVE